MKVLLDTNIILDIALKREPFFYNASKIFKLIDNVKLFGYITSTTITDIYYIAKREKGHKTAIEFIRNIIEIIDVIGVDKEVIIDALSSQFKDFEDAIQSISSKLNDIDFIITRNVKDFQKSEISAIMPEDFITKIIVQQD